MDTLPALSTKRAGTPKSRNHDGARRPRTTHAVEIVLASAQLFAATVTVLQKASAGNPVCGSMMWWTCRPEWLHRRFCVLDVATA